MIDPNHLYAFFVRAHYIISVANLFALIILFALSTFYDILNYIFGVLNCVCLACDFIIVVCAKYKILLNQSNYVNTLIVTSVAKSILCLISCVVLFSNNNNNNNINQHISHHAIYMCVMSIFAVGFNIYIIVQSKRQAFEYTLIV